MTIETKKPLLKILQVLHRVNQQTQIQSFKFDATGNPRKMNTLYFLVGEQLSKYPRKLSRLIGQLVVFTTIMSIVSAMTWARGIDDDRKTRSEACTKTTSAAFTACKHEASDNYWIAVGNCANISDPADHKKCGQDIGVAFREKLKTCSEHRQGRTDFCAAIGEAAYEPHIDPLMFADPNQIGKSIAPNPYFLLIPGRTMVYKIGNEEIRVSVTDKTRVIEGVTCREVHDIVRVNGQVIEDTLDWYAQDIQGNVWYFGEISLEYEDGVVVSIDGSWTAGVDSAKPGFAMKVAPVIGESYRQEFALNNAEDGAEVLSLSGSANVPAASCTNNCLITRDFSPIIPSLLEHKYFAPGVGFILEIKPKTGERLELVEIIQK